MDIKIEGIDEVLASIEKVGDTSRVASALGKGCDVITRAAKEKAPKDSGALRRSIQNRTEDGGNEIRGIVFTPLEYAPYVEHGTGLFSDSGGRKDVPWRYKDDSGNWHTTSGQHPQPFMKPALDENKDKVIKTIKEALAND